MQTQATTLACAASLNEPSGNTAELLGWPDATLLLPTCNLPVKALGLSKKVAHSNIIEPFSMQHIRLQCSVTIVPVHDSCLSSLMLLVVPTLTTAKFCFTSAMRTAFCCLLLQASSLVCLLAYHCCTKV